MYDLKHFEGKTILASDMKRQDWIKYRWVNVQEVQDSEPKYICTGLRPIEEAKEAAEQFDYWLYGSIKKD